MRKGLRAPRSYAEAKKRIQRALAQVTLSWRISGAEMSYRNLSYQVPVPEGAPPEIVSACKRLEADLEAERMRLSNRVARFYRSSGSISLVCGLLSRSPVFLHDSWIIDLLVEKKHSALLGPDKESRATALQDLRELAKSVSSIRLESWDRLDGRAKDRSNRRPCEAIRSDRPPRDRFQQAGLLNRYQSYLELATCLRAVRELTEESRNGKSFHDDEVLSHLAEDLGVPEDWLRDCSKGSTNLRQWTLRRMAEDEGRAVASVRRQLEDADRFMDKHRGIEVHMARARNRLDSGIHERADRPSQAPVDGAG